MEDPDTTAKGLPRIVTQFPDTQLKHGRITPILGESIGFIGIPRCRQLHDSPSQLQMTIAGQGELVGFGDEMRVCQLSSSLLLKCRLLDWE